MSDCKHETVNCGQVEFSDSPCGPSAWVIQQELCTGYAVSIYIPVAVCTNTAQVQHYFNNLEKEGFTVTIEEQDSECSCSTRYTAKSDDRVYIADLVPLVWSYLD